jgi:eukaryotic-like serine/threonine-protein kinase
MEPSSRTPEGEPNHCPICGKALKVEPSRPPGDAPCPYCGHLLWFAVASDGLVERGFHLGAYRVLRPLGPGAVSKVLLARHEAMGRQCVIKILPKQYQDNPNLLNRFRAEALAIARLDHPNIARVYDFNTDVRYGKGIAFVVMEYVEGRDLQHTVADDGPMEFAKAANYISQAAEGLAHAHQAGLVHRNIKPTNLLVDHNGVVKILDMGLSPLAIEQKPSAETGEQPVVGTADYVAPEQVADSRNVDGRSDIYSLGLAFYFLLTGRRPFAKRTIMEVLVAHREEKPEPIGNLRPDTPRQLIPIIEQMTAKSPAQRFQTAKEVADRIRAWLYESAGDRDEGSQLS